MSNSRNPYIDSTGEPTIRRSVVGFIDILGYADLVNSATSRAESQALLVRLHKALQVSRKHIDPGQAEDTLSTLRDKDSFALRAFTDNIVIGYPIGVDGEIELSLIFDNLSYFQIFMVMEGFFIRGAIAVGDFYMDDIAVFGSALMEAYEAEKTLARDPRIILTKSAQNLVNLHAGSYSNRSISPQNRDLLRDSDGQYFVHYLSTTIAENNHLYEQELVNHKSIIEEKLTAYITRPSIWSKYLWSAIYHNYFCDQSPLINAALKIDMDTYRITPDKLFHI